MEADKQDVWQRLTSMYKNQDPNPENQKLNQLS